MTKNVEACWLPGTVGTDFPFCSDKWIFYCCLSAVVSTMRHLCWYFFFADAMHFSRTQKKLIYIYIYLYCIEGIALYFLHFFSILNRFRTLCCSYQSWVQLIGALQYWNWEISEWTFLVLRGATSSWASATIFRSFLSYLCDARAECHLLVHI